MADASVALTFELGELVWEALPKNLKREQKVSAEVGGVMIAPVFADPAVGP